MKRLLMLAFLATASLWLPTSTAPGEKGKRSLPTPVLESYTAHRYDPGMHFGPGAPGVDTLVIAEYDFDAPGGGPDPQGWTTVDASLAPQGSYFHVDDFAGLGGGSSGLLVPLSGSRSLWCGAPAISAPRALCRRRLLGWEVYRDGCPARA